jgi:hypothetical protein
VGVLAITWAWRQDVPPGRKLVLLGLADTADDDGRTWPSLATVAEKAGLDLRSVRRHVAALEDDGLLRREHRLRGDGSRTSNLVVLALSTPPDTAVRSGQTVVSGREPSGEPSPLPTVEGRNARILSPADEPIGFAEWLGHHSIECKLPVPQAGTVGRTKLAQAFRNLIAEGRTMHELKLASTAMGRDEWRMADVKRRTPAVLLRPANIDAWIATGLELEASPRGDVMAALAAGEEDPRLAQLLAEADDEERTGTDG